MPTGHRKWKCLVMQIHPAEDVAVTVLPGYRDTQIYYKITRKGIRLNDVKELTGPSSDEMWRKPEAWRKRISHYYPQQTE